MTETTRLTDLRFFTECVDTTIPELASLPALAQAGDFDAAEHIFAEYVRGALQPEKYLAGVRASLEGRADKVRADGERALAHTFISCRVPYTYEGDIDWEFNPTYNNYCEWPWQLNRHPEWVSLANYYLLTGDERAAADWAWQMKGWAIQAQVPENASGYATICWRTIEAGIRMEGWAHVIHTFLRSPEISDETITIFFKSIWEHGWRLRNFNTARNWLIMEMNGLARIGCMYPFLRDSEEWLAYAHKRLSDEFDIQVYPDGMQNELTMGYHYVVVYNYERVLDMYRRIEKEPPAYLEEGLSKLYELYPKMARPDLICPSMNDNGVVNAVRIMQNALELYPDREDFRYIASNRTKGREPAFRSIFMEYGGATIFRDSWDENAYWAYMDASPFGTAHQHEDKLNVQIYALGHELIPEGGTFDYDTSDMRRYVLSTRSHNTIRVDGMDQAVRSIYHWDPADIGVKAEAFFETTDARDTVEATYREGYGEEHIAVQHTRRFLFLKKEAGLPPMFVAIDRLSASDEAKHSYEVIWHMHDNPVTLTDRTVSGAYEDGVGITVASSDGSVNIVRGMKTPVYQGWLPKFGVGDVEHYPIPTVENTGLFTGTRRIVTVLCPYQGETKVCRVEASADVADRTFTVYLTDGTSVTVTE